jgi:hypothetical protein
MEKSKITIIVEGGVITELIREGNSSNTEVIVQDYDIDNYDEQVKIETDKNNKKYTTYTID